MNPDLDKLQPYPFQKLSTLFDGITPASDKSPIRLSIGEPKHPTPDFIHAAMRANLNGLASYPLTRGSDDLREAITNWLTRRFNLPTESLNPARHILPVNGTREALFAFAQTMIDRNKSARVLMPNPFYQIYEGAALLAGAEPEFLNCTAENDFIPDFDAVSEQTWQDCQLLYLCSPGNPTGAVIPESTLQKLIERAIKYNFVIASDECYSEIYQDEKNPPPGLLGAAANMGNTQYKNCMVFHSLSKRSNAPGMRSGFVAGDAELINRFHLFRTYHGCAMSATTQAASTAAWKDETHVQKNREAYREKYSAVHSILNPILPVNIPPASFYLWVKTPVSDEKFAQKLYAEQHISVLPGSYLSRKINGANPGKDFVRMALVAELDECIEAAQRIKEAVQSL
ncbi:MAG TPA: succinyldiaminopimelate transaminase [Chromatiales bacterium]|nr:succinyldiaminopimelate transaminase [Chromatiales bacterium]